jgi:hypothetical protein
MVIGEKRCGYLCAPGESANVSWVTMAILLGFR